MKLLRIQSLMAVVCVSFLFTKCSDLEIEPTDGTASDDLSISSTSFEDPCLECTYVVPPKTHVIDGAALNLSPGSVICLDARTQYKNLVFRNIVGTASQPIIIKSCGGTAILNGTGLSFSLKTENSKFFRITGGDAHGTYGIQLEGGHIGLSLDKLSTNFTVDHVEVRNTGFAGIMAKTDPNCDEATWRGNFIMKNVIFHHNYVHDSGGEGFYVGNSFFANGARTACGTQLPHEIHYLRLYNNKVENTGWDGIQVGAATRGARVYGNTVTNFGTKNKGSQRSGVQLGEGTGGLFYGNHIKQGTGNGLTVLGYGDNVVHSNIIQDTGELGIFCDERYTPGHGFKFINNTILNTGSDGIRIYAETLPDNAIVNNVILNPGSFSTYTYPRSSDDSFIYKLSKTMSVRIEGNYLSTSVADANFIDLDNANFRPELSSPLIDQGADVSGYGMGTDFYKKTRIRGTTIDIGAAELQ